MWELYRLLKDGLQSKSETYLLHEAIRILDGISTENYKQSLQVMKIPELENPLENVLAFVKSLKVNEFFSFAQFVSGINSGNR
jgi:hypothetical protein